MNTRIIASIIAAGALMLPMTGHTGDSAKTFVKDSVITTKIKAELAKEKFTSLFKIDVDTTATGVVVLNGTAPDQPAIDRAIKIAYSVKGVTAVENNLTVKIDK